MTPLEIPPDSTAPLPTVPATTAPLPKSVTPTVPEPTCLVGPKKPKTPRLNTGIGAGSIYGDGSSGGGSIYNSP